MGRSLGYHDSDELDRPELNKCPDCECYFSTDECPLCGKICPEEFRAGHRAKVKPQKRRNSSGRVQFIPWYHSWAFILLMLYFMPIVGIILFFTSPHPRRTKIIVGCIAAGILLLLCALIVFGHIWYWSQISDPPVNNELTREEYMERCVEYSVEYFYRKEPTEGLFITMEAEVVARCVDDYGDVFYLCRSPKGGEARIYIRDCDLEKNVNYLPGDILRVYGESGGTAGAYGEHEYAGTYPCLNVAYCERVNDIPAEAGGLCRPVVLCLHA